MVFKGRVHSANLQDRAAVPLVLEGTAEAFPRLEHLWVDQGYTGTGKAWIEEHLGWSVEVVKHPPKARGEWQPHGDLDDLSSVWFEWVRLPPEPRRFRGPLPSRWVAEIVRTQMTTTYMLAARVGGDHVADLHLLLGYDHPIDE